MKRLLFIIMLFQLIHVHAVAQLKVNDISNISLGTSYHDSISKKKIIDFFSNENNHYEIWKGDFYNAFKINFIGALFDYYGESDYTFQYAKDTLSSIEVEQCFPAYKLLQFDRFLRQLVADLNSDPQKSVIKVSNDLNFNSIKAIAEKECEEGERINAKSRKLGGCTWVIKNSIPNGSNRIRVEVSIERGSRPFKSASGSVTKYYSGSWMKVRIIFLSVKTIDLFILTESGEDVNYSQVLRHENNETITWDKNGRAVKVN